MGIENNLHWVLDVGFREDQWLTRLQVEAANLAQLRRRSVDLLKLETESKMSIQRKRYRCSLDIDYMESNSIQSPPFFMNMPCKCDEFALHGSAQHYVHLSNTKEASAINSLALYLNLEGR